MQQNIKSILLRVISDEPFFTNDEFVAEMKKRHSSGFCAADLENLLTWFTAEKLIRVDDSKFGGRYLDLTTAGFNYVQERNEIDPAAAAGVEQLKQYCLDNYSKGGHWLIETKTDADFADILTAAGNLEKAKKSARSTWKLWNEQESNAGAF